MANVNNFKPFATSSGANVITQSDWEALPALLSGFTAGKASSAQVNKAIRQSTTIAALIGQFIANSGVDALDSGDITGLVNKFTNALPINMGFTKSIAGSGYIKLGTNGPIIVWGNGSVAASYSTDATGYVSIPLPIAMPNALLRVVTTHTDDSSTSTTGLLYVGNLTTTNFKAKAIKLVVSSAGAVTAGLGASSTVGFNFIGVGY